MNLRESLVTLIDFALEHDGDADPRVKKAIKRVREKAEVLGAKHERRMNSRPCQRCQNNCHGLLCWSCWETIPQLLRSAHESASTVPEKRSAARQILEYLRDSEKGHRP